MHLLPARRKTTKISLAVALWALASIAAWANDPGPEADRIVRQFAERSGAPGIAVSVGRCDRIVWSAGYGFADVEQQVRVDPAATKFRVGSVAKPMTALALVTLATEGKIDLDANVRDYVPTFPKKTHEFSVRQLAGHLAGIRHYLGDEAYIRTRYASVVDALTIFQDAPLLAVPGAEWKYSSYGYNLLSAVIERGANKPFLDTMNELVFSPLGMTATLPDRLDDVVPHRGRYYVRRDGKLHNEPEVDNSYKWASGGFLSTTDDLARFGLAHFNDQRVGPELRALLWTEQQTSAGQGTGYGIGWRIVADAEGNRWIGHGGGAIGGTTHFWVFPGSRLVIATASNLTELDFGDTLVRLRKLFLERAADQAEVGCPG